jgi:hypothetical protein|tara:strand:+ start:4158 stop:4511 length:354 start_codon:yes stop_codon:yes gene_type:complete
MFINYDYLAGMFEGFDYYQMKSNETAGIPEGINLEYLTLQMAADIGQLAKKVKERSAKGEPYNFKEQVNEDIGSILCSLSLLTDRMGLNMSDVAFDNISKNLKVNIGQKTNDKKAKY